MLRFENQEYLYALLLIPILVLLFFIVQKNRKKMLERFGEISLVMHSVPDFSKSRIITKFIILTLAFAFLVLGLANLQTGAKLEEVKQKGVDLIIALDVSNSMNAQDIKPSRLEAAKLSILNLVKNLKNDRLGMIIFAGHGYSLVPITTDLSHVKTVVENISTDIISTQGTAIGSAVELAVQTFEDEQERFGEEYVRKKNKAIIVITDGENHDEDAIEMVKEAKNKGIVVHTIGMGSTKGSLIPVKRNNRIYHRKDKDGNTITTRINEDMLKEIASSGDGVYVRANASSKALKQIYNEINKLEETELDTAVYTDYDDQFQYFIAISILLLVIEILVFERKNKLPIKLNIFGD